MNQNTWISWITTGIGLAGAAAATNGWISSSTATTLAGASVALVPFIWGLFVHSNTSVVQTAGSIPGVAPIEITPSAEPELQKLAMDPAVPSVVIAPPAPFVSSTITQRRT